RNFCDLGFGAAAVLLQYRAKRLVGQNAGEIVDATIALGLADDGDQLVRLELPVADASFDARGVLHVFQFHFSDFDSHYAWSLLVLASCDCLSSTNTVTYCSSCAGLTRASMPTSRCRGSRVHSRKFNRSMDCRVKPGNDALRG